MLIASEQKLWIDIVFVCFCLNIWCYFIRYNITSPCHELFPVRIW